MRTAIAGLAAAALLAAGLPAAAPARASVPACSTAGLVVWLDTQGNGAAGSVYYPLRFTNLSGRTCSLHGYPGVSAIDLHGRRIGRPAGRNPAPVRTVVLRRGATATATLRIVEAGNFPAARCRQTTAAGLRVYPPNQRASRTVPFPFAACRAAAVVLQVDPVGSI